MRIYSDTVGTPKGIPQNYIGRLTPYPRKPHERLHSVWHSAIVLLYEAWKLKSNGQQPIVKLTGSMLKRVGIGRDGKAAALLKLSELRLVGVEQVSGRNRSSLCTSSTRRLGETWGRGDNTARAADAIEYSQAGAESRH